MREKDFRWEGRVTVFANGPFLTLFQWTGLEVQGVFHVEKAGWNYSLTVCF